MTYLLLLVSCLAISRNMSSTPSPVLHDVLYTPDTKFLHCSQNPSMSASVTCIFDLRSNLFPHLFKEEKGQPFDRYEYGTKFPNKLYVDAFSENITFYEISF